METNQVSSNFDSGIFDDNKTLPVDDSTNVVTDEEMQIISYNIPPRNVRRVCEEFLQIRNIQVDHIEDRNKSNSAAFNKELLLNFKEVYRGDSLREDLYSSLQAASDEGLIDKESFQFLKCHPSQNDNTEALKAAPPAFEISRCEITDQEISSIAHKLAHTDIERISLEDLKIPRIDIQHAEKDSNGNTGDFATKCIHLWINKQTGGDLRKYLLECLKSSSSKGLINYEAYSFLESGSTPDSKVDLSQVAKAGDTMLKRELDEFYEFCEVDKNDITDVEMSQLAYHAPTDNMRRIAIEFLLVPLKDTEHVAKECGNKSWKFAYRCFHLWKNNYAGNNMRADLHTCLSLASEAGIMPADEFGFLKETQRKMLCPKTSLRKQSASNKDITDTKEEESDIFIFALLCQLISSLEEKAIEETAVDVFDFPNQDFRTQKRLLSRPLMFLVLSSWWRAQLGSCANKKYKLLDCLKTVQKQNLVPKEQLDHFVKQLGFQHVVTTKSDISDEPDGPVFPEVPEPFENYYLMEDHEFDDPKDELHCLSRLFHGLEDVEYAAVNIFGFSNESIKVEKRVALDQLMFNIFCIWWRKQIGSLEMKYRSFVAKLQKMENKRLVGKSVSQGITAGISQQYETTGEISQSLDTPQDQGMNMILHDVQFEETSDSDEDELDELENTARPTWWFFGDPVPPSLIYVAHMHGGATRYARTDISWIIKVLLPYAEGRMGLKLIIPDRQFNPGLPLLTNVDNYIEISKMVIHLVSKESMESLWNNEQLRTAIRQERKLGRHGRFIMHVVLPGTDVKSAPQFIKDSMKNHTTIFMKTSSDGNALKRLVNSINGVDLPLMSKGVKFISTMRKIKTMLKIYA